MRIVFLTLFASGLAVLIGVSGVLYLGIYDVGATAPHWPITHWVLETGRMRSIQAHASHIATPTGLDEPSKILTGTEHFAAHCSVCHGAPGVPRGEIANGLYPSPPDLRNAARRYTPSELFWIVKNGIKSTGMPSWSDHGDEELWNTVAFLEKMPAMDEEGYRKLVMENVMHGSEHRHGAMPMDHGSMPGMKMSPPATSEPPTSHSH